MEKILDLYGNEIHIGDYVVSTFSSGKYWSGFTYVHKVLGFEYDERTEEYQIVVDCNYPLDKRGTTTEFEADRCLVTTLHNYIQSQKSILRRIRDERIHPDENYNYTPPTTRELHGIYGTADWQRPHISMRYYDKKSGNWVENHPQTRKRKARKTNRFVMVEPSSETKFYSWSNDFNYKNYKLPEVDK